MLAIPGPPQLFFAGLVVIVLGVGLLKPNISTLVADLYPEGGGRRDAGFTIFYMGINLGAFIGPLIAGWLRAALRLAHRIPRGGRRHAARPAAVLAVAPDCSAAPARRPHRTGRRRWASHATGRLLGARSRCRCALQPSLLLSGIVQRRTRRRSRRAPPTCSSAWPRGYFLYLFFGAGLDPDRARARGRRAGDVRRLRARSGRASSRPVRR